LTEILHIFNVLLGSFANWFFVGAFWDRFRVEWVKKKLNLKAKKNFVQTNIFFLNSWI
jgi:hypothetical protein